jgi:hypothetical protein
MECPFLMRGRVCNLLAQFAVTLGPSHTELMTTSCSHMRLPQPEGPGPRIYILGEQGGQFYSQVLGSISQSVCYGVEPTLGLVTRYYLLSEVFCLKVAVLFLCGALSDKRTGLQFAVQSLNGQSRAELVTVLYCLIWDSSNLEGQVAIFMSPRNRVSQLYPPGTGLPLHYLLGQCQVPVYLPWTGWSSPIQSQK